MARLKIPSIAIKDEVFNEYDMNPFTAKKFFGVPIKVLIGVFVLIHFITKIFYVSDDDPIQEFAEEKKVIVFYWIIKIPLIILGYGLGILIIPIQILTYPFALLYVLLSKEKNFSYFQNSLNSYYENEELKNDDEWYGYGDEYEEEDDDDACYISKEKNG